MSITCNDIMKLKIFNNITLIAGNNGLDKAITWPYVGQTPSVSDWVHGGELLFITGIAHNEAVLPDLLNECIEKKLSGLVILVGSSYIKKIPQSIIDTANENNFPVFSMPWNLKLIDVTREITNLIIYHQIEQKKIIQNLGYLLFAPFAEIQEALNNNSLNSLKLDKYNFVSIFALSQIAPITSQYSVEEKLQQNIAQIFRIKNIKNYTMISGNSVIVLITENNKQKIAKHYSALENARELLSDMCADKKLLLASGSIYENFADIRTSYNEALSTLKILQQFSDRLSAAYQNLGIYRLFLQLQDNKEFNNYYKAQLSPLLDYDSKNSSELLNTLQCYLLTQNNISKTAQQLYIHRNTLLYRINKIQSLLDKDLTNAHTCMELYLAILVKSFLESKK